ncbi:hypothetical protein NB706_003174 [Xanthomonas sacchari]|nr:hypothetical protein [Xanthomonas sacchari]
MQALVGLQAVQDQLQVAFQFGRRGIGTGRIVQGRLQARAHQIVQQAVRHVAVTRPRARRGLRQQLPVTLQLLQQRRADRDQGGRLAEQAGELPQFLQIALQHRTPLRVEGGGDGGGIDVGVAVHVAADPGAEAQQPRQAQRLPVGLLDGVLQGLVHHRDHPVQHLGQVEADMLALVLHGGTHRRGIGGLPRGGQRHAEARRVGGALARGAQAVEVVDQAGHHQLFLLQQRAPHRLGRVRGEHRLDVDARQPVAQFVDADALRLEPAQGVEQAVRLRRVGAAALVVAAAADAVHALGDVDHLEIGAEGAHQRFGIARCAAGELLAQRGQRRGALAARDRGGADAFDLVEELRRDLFGEQVAHQGAEAAHVVAQGKVGGGEDDAAAGLVHRETHGSAVGAPQA